MAPVIGQLTEWVAISPTDPLSVSQLVTIALNVNDGFVALTLASTGLTTTAVDVPTSGKIVASVLDAAKSALNSISTVPDFRPPIYERLVSPIAVSSRLSADCDNVILVTYDDRSTLLIVTLALFNINVAMF
jgi:hypothetical protein